VKVQGLSGVIATGLRKTTVVMEEPKSTAPSEEEEELADPMDVETEETYIKAFDLDSSHSDAAMREAGYDWSQTDKEKQKNLDKQEFVEKKARQYVKRRKSSYVRTRISEALKSQRAHKKEKAKRENRKMPQTPPPHEHEEKEDFTRSPITQVCWLEHELTAVHSRLEQALMDLRKLIGEMSPVRTHEVAVLTKDKESVELVRIHKGMQVCPQSTQALLMAVVVRSCVRDGEKLFGDEGMAWRDRIRQSSWAHQESIDMVVDARIDEMDTAARAGRAYVVACTPRLVTSSIQAKQLGKDLLMWLGKV
jgi:hypothetical protein